MPRIEIGVGAVIAAIAGLGFASYEAVSIALLLFGVALILQGVYQVYYRPNFRLDKRIKKWLERHYWTVTESSAPKDKFYFAVWAQDEAKRRVMISREKEMSRLLSFTAPIDLDSGVIQTIGTKLSTAEQQKLYQQLHLLLASMHLGYRTQIFTNMAVQHALPIDDSLSEHAVDLKAKEVVDGVIAARSMIEHSVA